MTHEQPSLIWNVLMTSPRCCFPLDGRKSAVSLPPTRRWYSLNTETPMPNEGVVVAVAMLQLSAFARGNKSVCHALPPSCLKYRAVRVCSFIWTDCVIASVKDTWRVFFRLWTSGLPEVVDLGSNQNNYPTKKTPYLPWAEAQSSSLMSSRARAVTWQRGH